MSEQPTSEPSICPHCLGEFSYESRSGYCNGCKGIGDQPTSMLSDRRGLTVAEAEVLLPKYGKLSLGQTMRLLADLEARLAAAEREREGAQAEWDERTATALKWKHERDEALRELKTANDKVTVLESEMEDWITTDTEGGK